MDAIWFNQGQVCCAGSRLLVQESVAEKFTNRLKARMAKLRVGDPLVKSMDMGAIIAPIRVFKNWLIKVKRKVQRSGNGRETASEWLLFPSHY